MSTFLSGLPPGFRFHPTDEELVVQYLRKRVHNKKMDYMVIRDHDLYKCEPWDLPNLSLISSSDNEWFFFSPRDRKYPNGSRTNRATEAGYWKATGRDRTVKSNNRPIGMKKTLVFYKGRAPHGERMDWLMHEYRLEGDKWETANNSNVEHGYVLCRVFKKVPFESQHQQHNEQPEDDDERRDDSPHEGSNSWSPDDLDVKEDIPLIAMHPESAVDQKSAVTERYVSVPLSTMSAVSESTVAAPFSSQGQVSESDVSGPFSSMFEGVKEENDTFFQGLDLWMQSMPVTPATLAKIPEQVPERKDVDANFDNWDFGDPQTDLLGGLFDNPSALVGGNLSNWEIENYLEECPGLVDDPNELSPDGGSMVEETVCPAIQIRSRSTPLNPQVSWESFTNKYTAPRRQLYQKNIVQTSCMPPRSRDPLPAVAALAEKVPSSDRSSVIAAPQSEDINDPASELPSAAIAYVSDIPEESTSPRSESEDNAQSNSWAVAMIASPAADSRSTSLGQFADLDTQSATAPLVAEAGLEGEDETGKLSTDVDNDSKPTNVGGLLQIFVQPILAAAAADHSSAALQQANFVGSSELPAGIGSMRVNVVTITSTCDKVANQPQLQATIYNCFCNSTVPEGYNAEEKIVNSAVPLGKEGAILVTATRGSSKRVFVYLFLLGVLSASFVFLVANRLSKFLGKDL